MMDQELLSKLKLKPIGDVGTSIGTFTVYPVSLARYIAMCRVLGKKIKNCSPKEFICILASFVCLPKELDYESIKSDMPLFKEGESARLTEEDYEKISQVYIEGNEYLFKERITTQALSEKGGTLISFESGQIAHPRNEHESYTQYLHRLSIIEEEEQDRIGEEFRKKFTGIDSFSRGLTDSMRNIYSAGEVLKSSLGIFKSVNQITTLGKHLEPTLRIMDSIRKTSSIVEQLKSPKTSLHDASISIPEPILPRLDFVKLAQEKEERHIKPLRTINNSLSDLKDLTEETLAFQVNSNNVQMQIAGELKKSGNDASKYAKGNLLLSTIVIILTVFTCWMAYKANIDSNAESLSNGKAVEERTKEIVGILNSINSNVVNSPNTTEINRLNSLVQAQQQIILGLQKERDESRKRLDSLEKKMKNPASAN